MKIMDAGRIEVECAAKAGANLIDVLGAASDATIAECVQAGKNYGAKIVVDLISVADPVARAQQVEALGADYITVHVAIDDQMIGKDPFELLRRVSQAVHIPVGVAGGIHSALPGRPWKPEPALWWSGGCYQGSRSVSGDP